MATLALLTPRSRQSSERSANSTHPMIASWIRQFRANPYTFALLVTLSGLLLRLLVDPWLADQMPYITFVLAVAVTGLYVGLRPALLTMFLGAGIAYFAFVPPRYRWGFERISDAAGFAVYLLTALAVVAVIRARQQAAEVAARSIAEREKAQSSLAEMQALLNAFMDNSPACTYMKDAQGRRVYANETAMKVLKSWFPSTSNGQLRPHELEVLREGHALQFLDIIEEGGEERYWMATKFPFVDQSGHKFVGANLVDITDRIRAQELLQKTEQLTGAANMASLLAHEINNPLAGATNGLFLLAGEPLHDRARQYVDLVEEQVTRIRHITKLTLDLYREDETAKNVNVAEVADAVLQKLNMDDSGKHVQVKREYRGDTSLAARDDRVRALLHNLLSNSIESGSQSLRIRVAAAKDWHIPRRSGVRITISDSGCGIGSENRERIFKPFFSTKKRRGAGLGLWTTKVIVVRNGGSIRLRTGTHPGRRGTTVSVFLPTVAPEMLLCA